MPLVTLDLTAMQPPLTELPIVWRLGRMFNVVTNVRRARVAEDFGYVQLDVEGSTQEVEQATNYVRALGLTATHGDALAPIKMTEPENTVSQANTIYVRLSTVNPAQFHVPILYRLGKDYPVVVNLRQAAFDDDEGGWVEITIAGPLALVQRAISYLHTTGLHVNPRQRSVTDFSNL